MYDYMVNSFFQSKKNSFFFFEKVYRNIYQHRGNHMMQIEKRILHAWNIQKSILLTSSVNSTFKGVEWTYACVVIIDSLAIYTRENTSNSSKI